MLSEDRRLFELVDQAFDDEPPPKHQYSLSIVRDVCQLQSDEALELARRCGVEVPKETRC